VLCISDLAGIKKKFPIQGPFIYCFWKGGAAFQKPLPCPMAHTGHRWKCLVVLGTHPQGNKAWSVLCLSHCCQYHMGQGTQISPVPAFGWGVISWVLSTLQIWWTWSRSWEIWGRRGKTLASPSFEGGREDTPQISQFQGELGHSLSSSNAYHIGLCCRYKKVVLRLINSEISSHSQKTEHYTSCLKNYLCYRLVFKSSASGTFDF
jgi:hypothetical protein